VGGAMRCWGCGGRELITRAESLQARAKHAYPHKPQWRMIPC